MVILKSSSWSSLIGQVSRYEKLLMSGAGLKLIVNCLSYLENIIADHEQFPFVPAWIIKGKEGYLCIITPGYCHTFSALVWQVGMGEEWRCLVVIQQEKKNTWCGVKDNALKSISPTTQTISKRSRPRMARCKMPSCSFHASALLSAFRACGCCSTDSDGDGVKAFCADSNGITNCEKQRLWFRSGKLINRGEGMYPWPCVVSQQESVTPAENVLS